MDHHHRNRENNDDGDVIAYIYPAVDTQGYQHAKNSIGERGPLYLGPRIHRVVETQSESPDRHERERTAEEGEGEGQLRDDLDYEACIRVPFDSIPKTRHGLRVGRHSDAEFRILNATGVSDYHFALTFDDHYRLIVRDLDSTCGTSVMYDKMERGRWRSFDWIVGGSGFLQKVNTIVVKVTQFLQFQLVIPRHDIDSRSYRERVDRFRAGATDAEQVLDLGRLGPLSRIITVAPSGARTPITSPNRHVTVHKELGTGAFGVVYHVWTVNTGEEYARKEPKQGSGHDAQWKTEIVIMKRISHVRAPSISTTLRPITDLPFAEAYCHVDKLASAAVAVASPRIHARRLHQRPPSCRQIL